MMRATVICGAALVGLTALAGCGPSESEAAPIRRDSPAPTRRTVAAPAVSEVPATVSNPVAPAPRSFAASGTASPAPADRVERETRVATAEREALEEGPASGEIGIVPSESHIDVGAETLERRLLLDGKLSLLVPRSFTEMGPVMLQAKYPSQNRPTMVLTNESGAVNVAVNFTSNRVTQKDLPAAFNVIRAQLRNAYPTAHWYASELTNMQGRPCFTLDFRTPAVDTQVRNIMVGTVVDGRLLLVSFNTTRELEDTWAPIGEAIVDSITID